MIADAARETVAHRDIFSGSFWAAEVNYRLACGFAYACPAKMPGEGGLNATVEFGPAG
jgi:hypothetical protein